MKGNLEQRLIHSVRCVGCAEILSRLFHTSKLKMQEGKKIQPTYRADRQGNATGCDDKAWGSDTAMPHPNTCPLPFIALYHLCYVDLEESSSWEAQIWVVSKATESSKMRHQEYKLRSTVSVAQWNGSLFILTFKITAIMLQLLHECIQFHR